MKTRYSIMEENILQINFLFFKKRIEISSIKKIESSKVTIFYNRSYATSSKGLALTIGDMIFFITPMYEDVFVEELLKINPSIQT